MIFGIGTDLVEVERIRRVWERRGERFVARILCPEELPGFRRTKNPVRFLATRFAGKEAVVKAMGTGFSHGLWVRDVGIVADAWGKPCVIFSARGRGMPGFGSGRGLCESQRRGRCGAGIRGAA